MTDKETPAEHIRNALQILKADGNGIPEDIRASIGARLVCALRQIEHPNKPQRS